MPSSHSRLPGSGSRPVRPSKPLCQVKTDGSRPYGLAGRPDVLLMDAQGQPVVEALVLRPRVKWE